MRRGYLLSVGGYGSTRSKRVIWRKGTAIGRACDVNDKEDYEAWLEEMAEQLGGVDIFIPELAQAVVLIASETGGRAFEVDVLSTVRGCEVLLPHMKESGGGAITFITTTASVETFGGPQAYNAMKGSLLVYAKQLSQEVGRDGIRVNCVSPGPIYFEGGVWQMLKDTMAKWFAKVEKGSPIWSFGHTGRSIKLCAVYFKPCS